MITQDERPNIADTLLTPMFMLEWQSVQNGEVTVSRPFVPTKATNRSVMHNTKQINFQWPELQDQNSLMLCWRSFSEWGRDCAPFTFANKGRQYRYYTSQLPNDILITWLTRPKIVHASLTHIVLWGNEDILHSFEWKGSQYIVHDSLPDITIQISQDE
jgi:hypothetical protein